MAIHDERFPLTGEELAEIERHREAMRLLPLAMASADISTPETRAAWHSAICARVRERFEDEVSIDPGDEQLGECVGCHWKDAEIRAKDDAIRSLCARLEDETGLYLAEFAERKRLQKELAKVQRPAMWTLEGSIVQAVGLLAAAGLGMLVGGWMQ